MPEIDRRSFVLATGAVTMAASDPASAQPSRLMVSTLKTEYIDRPLGVEETRPRLSWRLESAERGVRQGAYRITAASSEAGLMRGAADLWDSGRVASDQCFEIPYGGPALHSAERVYWRVQVWDQHGLASIGVAPTWFEMGLLSPSDWQAQWLNVETPDHAADRAAGLHWIWGAESLAAGSQKFRYRFSPPADPTRAQLWLSAKDHLLGVWLNGIRLAQPDPVFWGTMTVFPLKLADGLNLLCVEAKADVSGFFPVDGGAVVALLKLSDVHGHVTRLTTGPDWRTSTEDPAGWTDPGFDDRTWAPASRTEANVRNEPWPAEPPMLLRRGFHATRPVARARLYQTALGAHDARINGHRISTQRLAPEISVASDHVLYQVNDVTALVQPGENALGVVVGDGFYASAFGWRNERYAFGPGPRRYLARLVIDYADGDPEVIVTSADWRMGASPILSSQIYNGEVFDARLRTPGWDTPGFDESGWAPMKVGQTPPIRLVAQLDPPIRQVQTLFPRSISEPQSGVFVFDFGQNFAGWCRLSAKGQSGTTVTLRFAEILLPSGRADPSNLRGARATDSFTLRGDTEGETFEPHFTYHGFRYVEVTGYPGRPNVGSLTAVVAHTDCTPTGRLEAAQPLVQQIWRNALWSQRSNFFGVPTDCPQRDERMGWMGDIQVFLDAASFNQDVNAFIRRFMLEVRAGQTPDGAFPIVTPQPLSFPAEVTAGWSEAGVILPWTLYRRYGDTRIISQNWAAMSRWIAYVADVNPDHIWRKRRGLDLGDWLSVDAVKPDDETTPRVLCATAYWAYAAQLMAEMATATGRAGEAARYEAMHADIARAFAQAFVRPDGTVGNGSQTSYVLALKFDLVPQSLRLAAGNRLAEAIHGRGDLLSTGFLGTPYLLDVLADNGHADLAVTLLLQTRYPSWGHMVAKGATTMWERWNGDVGDVAMNSYNHYAFGAVVGFMYRRLGGIAAATPGFRRIEVDPVFDARIGRVRTDYDSVLGRISTEVDGDAAGMTRLGLTVPANATATIRLPAQGRGWSEGRRPLQPRADLRVMERTGAGIVVEVDSGAYIFSAV